MKYLITLLMLLLFLTACQPSEIESESVTTSDSPKTKPGNAPVETAKPNTSFAPAFDGQTRAKGVLTEAELEVQTLTTALNEPWGITTDSEGRLFITEKGGSLRIFSQGELTEPITGFPEIQTSGQGGLLDVALSPDYPNDGTIYFTYSLTGNGGAATAVGSAKLSSDETTLEGFQTIYTAEPFVGGGGHFGSRIAFSDDGVMYISTGDRQAAENRPMVQKLDNGWGKIVRIDIAANNQASIYSYGHRNVQGLAIDPRNGDLWAAEMGPQGGDELNLIQEGKNYGWPLVSYGEEYSGAKIGDGIAVLEGTEQPVYYWDPVIAPAGITFYDATLFPEWQNNLFVSGLRGSHLARLVIEEQKVVGEERLLADLGERFRDVCVGNDGALYTITDSGKLIRISPKQTNE